jgi:hypothetical protein
MSGLLAVEEIIPAISSLYLLDGQSVVIVVVASRLTKQVWLGFRCRRADRH